MSRWAQILVGSAALVAVVAFGGWWFVLRSDPPPEAALPDCEVSAGTPDGSSTGGDRPDGTWTVVPGDGVFVGYRIEEVFGGDTFKRTVVGRTPTVEGTLVVTDGRVVEAELVADVTALESDQGRRDRYLHQNALETESFPEATFTLTEPIDLGPDVAPRVALTGITATGDLTLHGVTRPTTVTIDACWSGASLDLAGRSPVLLADHDIETPDIPGTVTVDPDGELEFTLVLERG